MTSPSAAVSGGMHRTIQRQSPGPVLAPLSSTTPAAAAASGLAGTTPPSAASQQPEPHAAALTFRADANRPEEQIQAVDDDEWMDWETRRKEIPILKHIIAGSSAGIMEHVGMFPLDTIKTHMQASGRRLGMRSIASILYQDEGLLRFWKGAQVMASGCVPAHASYFLAYEHLKMFLGFENEELNFTSTLTIGCTTTFAHDFFITPADVMKQRLQLCKNLTVSQCFKDIMREEGLRGLYRSYPLTVSMNIPFASCVVCVNENLKTIFKPWERQHSYAWYFLCAGVSGGLAGLLTNPLDVVKTRLQTQEVRPSCIRLQQMWENSRQREEMQQKRAPPASGGLEGGVKVPTCCNAGPDGGHHPDCRFQVKPSRYQDFKSTVKYIYRTEGAMAFTKGILPRMSINVPSTALSWGTYELIKSCLIGSKSGGD